MTTVSIMPIGAGSRADSARPTLPTTVSTSGTLRMAMSWVAITFCTAESDPAGTSEGMYNSEPSSNGGMNSRPRPGNRCFNWPHASHWVTSKFRRARPASIG